MMFVFEVIHLIYRNCLGVVEKLRLLLIGTEKRIIKKGHIVPWAILRRKSSSCKQK